MKPAITKTYASEYQGEFVIRSLKLESGSYEEKREWIPKTVTNDNHSGHCVVFGNGRSLGKIPLQSIKVHKGTHLGANKLQTYGCNLMYEIYSPDFLIITSPVILASCIQSGYNKNNLVYTTTTNLLKYPGEAHLIPSNPNFNAGALALYLACFDGQKKIYMIGFDNQSTQNYNNNFFVGKPGYDTLYTNVSDQKWIRNTAMIMNTYDDVEFVRVNASGKTPDLWKDCVNYREISFRQMVFEADLG